MKNQIKISIILEGEEKSSVELPIEDAFNKKASFDFVESAINSKFNYDHIALSFQDCLVLCPCSYYFLPLLEMAINKAFS